MVLENKLGITESAELAREEERISKTKALELFELQVEQLEVIQQFLKSQGLCHTIYCHLLVLPCHKICL